MIEQILIEYLTEELSLPVYTEIPEDMSGEWILIRVTNRGMRNHVESVSVELFAYAESKYEAASLDKIIRETMPNIVERDDVMHCDLGGGRDDTDSANKIYRYKTFWNFTL